MARINMHIKTYKECISFTFDCPSIPVFSACWDIIWEDNSLWLYLKQRRPFISLHLYRNMAAGRVLYSLLDNVDSDLLYPPSFLALPPSLACHLIKLNPSESLFRTGTNKLQGQLAVKDSSSVFLHKCRLLLSSFTFFCFKALQCRVGVGVRGCVFLWGSWTHVKGKKMIAGSFQHIGAKLHFLLSVLQELKPISGIHHQTWGCVCAWVGGGVRVCERESEKWCRQLCGRGSKLFVFC